MGSDTEGMYESIYGQLGGTFWQQGAAFGLQKKVKVVVDSTVPFTAQGIEVGYSKILSRRPRGKVVCVMTP